MDKPTEKLTEMLTQPFEESEIEWRVGRAGAKNDKPWVMALAYITSRAVMDRLDKVFGIDGWQDRYEDIAGGGIRCYLSCKIDREWITKCDASDVSDIEAVKGGHSGALKRAVVKFGVGRYLYHLTDNFGKVSPNGKFYQPAKTGKYPAFKWNPPSLPAWALPKKDKPIKPAPKPTSKTVDMNMSSVEYTEAELESTSNPFGDLYRGKTLGELYKKNPDIIVSMIKKVEPADDSEKVVIEKMRQFIKLKTNT